MLLTSSPHTKKIPFRPPSPPSPASSSSSAFPTTLLLARPQALESTSRRTLRRDQDLLLYIYASLYTSSVLSSCALPHARTRVTSCISLASFLRHVRIGLMDDTPLSPFLPFALLSLFDFLGRDGRKRERERGSKRETKLTHHATMRCYVDAIRYQLTAREDRFVFFCFLVSSF